MEIGKDLMDYLEELSRLQLTEEEKEKTKKDLASILSYMDTLNELDTGASEPVSHAISLVNIFRVDEVKNQDKRKEILSNAPEQKDGFFVVPKTVE